MPDLRRRLSQKVVPAGVADVARLQVAPQKLAEFWQIRLPKSHDNRPLPYQQPTSCVPTGWPSST